MSAAAALMPSASQPCLDEACLAGIALNFAMSRKRCREWTLAQLEARILEPQRHHQLKFYFDSHGNTAAFVTWAWLTPQVLRRLVEDSTSLLHPTEWREGEYLCIVDLIVADGMLPAIVEDLRNGVFAHIPFAHWLCRAGSRRRAIMLRRAA